MKFIEVINWKKFNPRDDYHSHWFRLESAFTEDPKFYDFDTGELMVFVVILAVTCQQQGAPWPLNQRLLSQKSRVKISKILPIIGKLEQLHVVRCSDGASIYAPSLRTDERTNEQTAVFDFDSVYQKYPRKLGKKAGMAALKGRIKTQEGFDLFARAVENYAAYVEREKKAPEFIKQFSTFVNCYEDWVDVETPKPQFTKVVESLV